MNKKVIKVAIIISWVLLGVCIIFKLCGSNVFELAIKNQGVIDACAWLDTDGRYLLYVIGFLMSVISNTFILMASALIYKPTWKQLLLIEGVNIPLSVNELAEKHFVEPQTIKQDRWRYKKKIS